MEWNHAELSLRRQCALLSLPRSTLYNELQDADEGDLELMRLLDKQYLETPFYGSRRMRRHLLGLGYLVNRRMVLTKGSTSGHAERSGLIFSLTCFRYFAGSLSRNIPSMFSTT